MRRRSLEDWLTMIGRTRPSRPALLALERELAASEGLGEAERRAVRAALDDLAGRVPEPEAGPAGPGERPEAMLDYRPEGQGGRGRLYLELRGREQLTPGEPFELKVPDLYLFSDGEGFSGLQVDAANSLPERLPAALAALRPLPLPRVDCPRAGLEDVHVAEVLEWASERLVEGR